MRPKEPLPLYLQISTLREACILVQKAGTPPGCVNPEQKTLQMHKPPQYIFFLLPKDYLQDKNLPQIKTHTLYLLKCNRERRAFHTQIRINTHTNTRGAFFFYHYISYIYLHRHTYTHTRIYFMHAYICLICIFETNNNFSSIFRKVHS